MCYVRITISNNMPHTRTQKTMLLSFLPSSASQFFVSCLFFLPKFLSDLLFLFNGVTFTCIISKSVHVSFRLPWFHLISLSWLDSSSWFRFVKWHCRYDHRLLHHHHHKQQQQKQLLECVALHYMAVAFMGYTMLKDGNDLGNDPKWLQLSHFEQKGARDNKTTKSAKRSRNEKTKTVISRSSSFLHVTVQSRQPACICRANAPQGHLLPLRFSHRQGHV